MFLQYWIHEVTIRFQSFVKKRQVSNYKSFVGNLSVRRCRADGEQFVGLAVYLQWAAAFSCNGWALRAQPKMLKINLENLAELHLEKIVEIRLNLFANYNQEFFWKILQKSVWKFCRDLFGNFVKIHLENFAEIRLKLL